MATYNKTRETAFKMFGPSSQILNPKTSKSSRSLTYQHKNLLPTLTGQFNNNRQFVQYSREDFES